jgi:hypothetical protein
MAESKNFMKSAHFWESISRELSTVHMTTLRLYLVDNVNLAYQQKKSEKTDVSMGIYVNFPKSVQYTYTNGYTLKWQFFHDKNSWPWLKKRNGKKDIQGFGISVLKCQKSIFHRNFANFHNAADYRAHFLALWRSHIVDKVCSPKWNEQIRPSWAKTYIFWL